VPDSAPSTSDEARIRVAFPAASATGELPNVGLVTLDRPKALNAIDFALLAQLTDAVEGLDADPACRAIVIAGGERAFAAGVDIRQLNEQSPVTLLVEDEFHRWDRLKRVRTPLIAAVRGVALGGGCELAMLCDLIVAGDDATFGQPEIRLGLIPGAGGSQRLTRAVGKARAMDMILTGRTIDAREAAAHGLVSRVVPAEATLESALQVAATVAAMPPVAATAAKQAVNRAFELPLEAGLEAERQAFYLLFATEDMHEGATAFLEKRSPTWRGR
jgi:enoyl-CoA hydratase